MIHNRCELPWQLETIRNDLQFTLPQVENRTISH